MSDPLAPLREALRLSPDNIPLRQHLAESLLAGGQPEQAEAEFREALSLAAGQCRAEARPGPGVPGPAEGLGGPRHRRRPGRRRAPRRAGARALCPAALRRGEVPNAVAQYKLGVEKDADAADGEFAGRLGIGAGLRGIGSGRRPRAGGSWDEAPEAPPAEIERPKITFADVGGMDALKDEIRLKIIHPLQAPGAVQGLRQDDRRRHPDVRPARLRQDAPGPGDRRRDQGRLHLRRHQRRARHVDRQQRAEPARAVRAGPRATSPACCSSTRSMPSAPAAATCSTAPAGT